MKLNDGNKGISLPINMLVILSVSVIVLLAVVAFFMGAFETEEMEEESLRQQCCQEVVFTHNMCDPGAENDDWDEVDVDEDWDQDCDDLHQYDPVEACC